MFAGVVAVLVCVGVLYGFHRAGELRWFQLVPAVVGGFVAGSARLGPVLGHGIVTVYWWVGSWPL